jgi:hypothetical protein
VVEKESLPEVCAIIWEPRPRNSCKNNLGFPQTFSISEEGNQPQGSSLSRSASPVF